MNNLTEQQKMAMRFVWLEGDLDLSSVVTPSAQSKALVDEQVKRLAAQMKPKTLPEGH